ncbi:hypothetical protein Q4509_09910 [Oceanihabitans sp. 1_MG-2023]|nr:hypothetical protein [Oceanihabitans sp. 1_MG-2023]
MFSFINVIEVVKNHYKTLKSDASGNIFIFIVLPICIGVISIFAKAVNSNLDSILSTALSIFIGLFINLLVLIVTLTRSPIREKKEIRRLVVEGTFYNITYVILISIVALGLIMLKNINFGFNEVGQLVFKKTIVFLFTFLFSQILLTILLIIKRIFNLFKFDINNFNK